MVKKGRNVKIFKLWSHKLLLKRVQNQDPAPTATCYGSDANNYTARILYSSICYLDHPFTFEIVGTKLKQQITAKGSTIVSINYSKEIKLLFLANGVEIY